MKRLADEWRTESLAGPQALQIWNCRSREIWRLSRGQIHPRFSELIIILNSISTDLSRTGCLSELEAALPSCAELVFSLPLRLLCPHKGPLLGGPNFLSHIFTVIYMNCARRLWNGPLLRPWLPSAKCVFSPVRDPTPLPPRPYFLCLTVPDFSFYYK